MKMPSDILPMMLSTGVGMGVLAGVVSGVCFLVFNGYAWSRRVRQGEKLRSEEEVNCSLCSAATTEECSSCSLPLCSSCSTGRHGTIRCQACTHDRFVFTRELKSGNSFLNYLRESSSFGYQSESEDNLNRSKVSSAIGAGTAEDLESEKRKIDDGKQVRDFLQRLAEHLTGGTLDDVAVSRMYQHPEYLPLPAGQVPSTSSPHAKLQNLVQRVIEEALKLPAFLDYSGIDRDSEGRLPQFSPQTYEDLLATAILNKVIDKYQHDVKRSNGASSSGVHSGSSSPGNSARARRRKHGKRDSSPSPSPDQSSLEPMSHDDYGHSDSSGHVSETRKESFGADRNEYSTDEDDMFRKSYNNPVDGALSNMNFKNKNRISFPEYGGDIVDADELIHSNMNGDHDSSMNGNVTGNGNIYANNNSWEENWLFQKKKIKSSQSGPVPMVIPSSNTDYRVLIGDKDVEDTTDLSDAGSDNEDTPNDIKHVLVNSKTIIGGKNPDIIMSFDKNDTEINNNDEVAVKSVVDNNSIIHHEADYTAEIVPKQDVEYVEMRKKTPDLFKQTYKTNRALSRFLSSSLESDDTDAESTLNPYSSLKMTPSIIENIEYNGCSIAEATNLDVVDRKENEGSESLCNHQKDGEYTETVAVPVQRHLDSLKRQHNISQQYSHDSENEEDEPPPLPPTPIPRLFVRETSEVITLPIEPIEEKVLLSDVSNTCESAISTVKEDIITEPEVKQPEFKQPEQIVDPISDDATISDTDIPGSIAEREHKKWLNAVPMANNPYSPEAIQSRLNKQKRSSVFDLITLSPAETSNRMKDSASEDNVRYSRDYYINEAKASMGKSIDKKPLVKTAPLVSSETSEAPTSNTVLKTVKMIENMEEIYIASPAIAEDIDNQFDEIYKTATKNDDASEIKLNKNNVVNLLKVTNGDILHDDEFVDYSDSLSSLDDVQRVYNINTGKSIIRVNKEKFNDSNAENTNLSNSKQWKSTGDVYFINDNNKMNTGTTQLLEEGEVLPSVKELAKKFISQSQVNPPPLKPKRRDSHDIAVSDVAIKPQPSPKLPIHMHSLTARSISKEFRDELKSSMPVVTNPHPGGSKSVPDGINELVKEGNTEEGNVPVPGSLKKKLNFYEELNKK